MLKLLITAFLSVLINGCADLNTVPEGSDKKDVDAVPKHTLRTLASIPEDLKQQSYKDARGNDVSYNHKAQLERLFQLEKEGKTFNLIVAHQGQKDTVKKPPQGKDEMVIIGQQDKSVFVESESPNLLMNFDKEEHLKTLPDNFFSMIMFDYCVISHFSNLKNSVLEFHRILRPDGKFKADLSYGAIGMTKDNQEFDNTCAARQGNMYKTKSGLRYCLENWNPGGFLVGNIGSGGIRDLSSADRQEIQSKRKELIKKYLESFFGSCLIKTADKPAYENDEFIECAKQK